MSWEIPELAPLIEVPDLPVWNEIPVAGGEPMYWGRDGQPMTLRQWVTGCELDEYRVLGRTTVGDVTVVTAWLGVAEHFFDTPERRLIYGTIELRHGRALRDGGKAVSNEVLSSFEEDAKAEHERRVAALRAVLDDSGRTNARKRRKIGRTK